MRTQGRRRLVLLLGVVLVVAGACGIPEDNRPQVIAAADQPVDLDPTSTTLPDEVCAEGSDSVSLFFLLRDAEEEARLRRIIRCVPAAGAGPAIQELLRGPQPGEPDLDSAIPPDTTLLGTSVDADGVMTINLGPADGGIAAVGGEGQQAAFAQLVYTALRVAGVRLVRFQVDSQPFPALTAGERGATTEPVTAADYEPFRPG